VEENWRGLANKKYLHRRLSEVLPNKITDCTGY